MAGGAVTDTYEYDAFGNLLNKTGSTPNNYLYRGEQFDSDLGLYYLRARYYNPLSGRFMGRDANDPAMTDPLGVPIDPRALHKYLYAGADAVNRMDPTGRDDIIEDTLVITERSLKAVDYLNTIGCYSSILFTSATAFLSKDLDASALAGVGATYYGCIFLSWEPEGRILKAFKSGLDLGACAIGALATINDLNEYLDKPTPTNEAKLVADDVGSVLGCGLTGLAAAFE